MTSMAWLALSRHVTVKKNQLQSKIEKHLYSLYNSISQVSTMETEKTSLPTTMKAWQWSRCPSTLEEAIELNHAVPLPTAHRALQPGECLIKVHAAALNPVDYKLAELPVVGRMAISKPATPGLDFAGRVVQVGADCDVVIGQKVFGKLEPKQQIGTLGEYIVGSKAGTIPLPEGISMEHAATLGVCGLVAYQCLAPNVKAGQQVLINGGAGGTGTFAIQIAKALGCTVTATCSGMGVKVQRYGIIDQAKTGTNIQLCKDLGATRVLDYTKVDVPSLLSKGSQEYDFVLDTVGLPSELYWKSPAFTKPGAKYVQIGSQVSLSFIFNLAFRFFVPTWLGGGQRPFSFGLATTNATDYLELAHHVEQGTVRPVIDRIIDFKHVPGGYRYLRQGHAKGKVVVQIGNGENVTKDGFSST
jgi:NADPH:quinone reductase-like Zn-dependent oxidoreductase